MDKILEALYDHFYEKPELTALQESVEANHNLLRERLGKLLEFTRKRLIYAVRLKFCVA